MAKLKDWRQETLPALQEIRRLLKETGMSQRRLEERAGFSRGYVSQLLGRNLDLKLFHVIAILDALNEDVAAFFKRTYPAAKKRRRALDEFRLQSGPLTEEIDELLGRLYEYGVDSLRDLKERLEQCEKRMARFEEILEENRRRKREG